MMDDPIKQFLTGLIGMIVLIMLMVFGSLYIHDHAVSQKEADFSVVRRLTVIGNTQDDILFSIEGRMFIQESGWDNRKIEITMKDEAGNDQKHTVSLSDGATYTIEELPDYNPPH